MHSKNKEAQEVIKKLRSHNLYTQQEREEQNKLAEQKAIFRELGIPRVA